MRINWRSSTFLAVAMWGVGFLVAMAIPDQPRSYRVIDLLVTTFGAVIPAIARLEFQSPIANIAQAYWAIMWLVALAWLPLHFKLTDQEVKPIERARRHPVGYRFSPIVALLLFVYMFFLPLSEPGRLGTVMLGSHWGLGIVASPLFACIPLFIRALITWYRYLPILEPKTDREQE